MTGALPDRWASRRRDVLALAAIAFAPWLFYWPLFAPGPARRYFEGGDFVDQFVAFAAHEVRSFAAGQVPLWNPYAYGGSPFWADIQSAVAYPFSLANVLVQTALGLNLQRLFTALEAEAVLHLSLAGVFTFLFARRVLGSRAGAVIGALAFTWGGYLTGYPPLQLAVLETVVWLPLVLLGVDLVVRPGGRMENGTGERLPERTVGTRRPAWAGIIVLALAIGLAVLAGHPQSAMYVLYAGVAWAAWRTWPWRRAGRRVTRSEN